MPVTFQVVGNLADFGNDARTGVEVRATATPGVKVGDVAVHSNEPETVTTDSNGAFTLTLVSLPGVWYRITTPARNLINPVNLAGYVPDSEDPTTGTEFPALTVINLRTVMNEDPTPGYEAIAYAGGGGGGGVTDHGALTGLGDDDHAQYALADGTRGNFASKRLLQDAVVDVHGNGTHTTITAALADIAPGGRIVIRQDPDFPIASHWQDGPILLPNINGVTIEGWGKEVAGIAFPSGSSAGFYFDGTANPRNWVFRNLYIFSIGPLDEDARGTVGRGIDLSGATTCIIEDVRISGWLEGISGNGATQESHHMRFVNLRITNCGTGIKTTGTTAGTNNWQVIGGEISGNGVGIDTPGGAWRVMGPSFESNGLAIRYGGEASRLDVGRLEGNTQDIELLAAARNNVIDAPMLDVSNKFTDLSTSNTNTVNLGTNFSYIAVENPRLLQTLDPRLTDESIVPGAGVGLVVKIVASQVTKVSTVTIVPTVTGGDVEVGFIDPQSGTDVISNTSGPQTLGSMWVEQVLTLATPVYLSPGREYRIAVVLSSATAGIYGSTSTMEAQRIVLGHLTRLSMEKVGMYPLAGKTYSGLQPSNHTPWLLLR